LQTIKTKKSKVLWITYFGYILPFNPSRQRPIAILALQRFFVDGFSLCEQPVRQLTAGFHSKVDIVPFYLMFLIHWLNVFKYFFWVVKQGKSLQKNIFPEKIFLLRWEYRKWK